MNDEINPFFFVEHAPEWFVEGPCCCQLKSLFHLLSVELMYKTAEDALAQ